MSNHTTKPADVPARTDVPGRFVPPALTPLGRVYDITLGSGTNPFSDGIFGS